MVTPATGHARSSGAPTGTRLPVPLEPPGETVSRMRRTPAGPSGRRRSPTRGGTIRPPARFLAQLAQQYDGPVAARQARRERLAAAARAYARARPEAGACGRRSDLKV